MAVARQVQAYFDKVATGYQAASQSSVWSRIRLREQKAFLGLIGDVTGSEILELGCGTGYYTRLLLAAGARHIVAVDFSARMLAELPTANVTPLLGDAITIDPGRTFDRMVSAGMLEFVPDPAAVLRNAARFANPGADLTILHPTNTLLGRAYRRFHRRNGMQIHLFDTTGLQQMAEAAGWRITATSPAGPYSACARLQRIAP